MDMRSWKGLGLLMMDIFLLNNGYIVYRPLFGAMMG